VASGWSNTLLNSNGMLYTTGKLDGTQLRTESAQKQTLMEFSPAYPPTTPDRYEPSTAIKQFSSGRRHVLALSDSGKIWYWTNQKPAMQVRFLHLDILEGDQRHGNRRGVVKKVVAGWEESSAYVSGAGIVYWNIFKNEITHDEADEPDTVLLDANIIPRTDFKRPKTSTRESNQQAHEIGEVLNHVVLHEYIVFITDLNKVFAMNMKPMEEFDESDRGSGIPPNNVFELTTFSAPDRQFKDIQGAFERFAVFSSDGSVQIGDRNMLRSFWNHQRWPLDQLPNPKILPALQSSNVISLAFGDHHMHALHSSGRISSYGTEPQGCGALGLGEKQERFLRGVYTLTNRDGTLVPHAEHHPHYIWFEEDKRNWLYRLSHTAQKSSAHERRNAIIADLALQGEFSEWIEQEGLAWDDFPDIRAQDPDGLGAYFALTVAAAGWHSCALVLVNDDLAKQVKIKHIHGGANIPPDEEYLLIRSDGEAPSTNGYENKAIQAFRYDFFDQPFPRLRLPSGYEMPGEGAFNEWRYGMPPARWRA
jgi:SCF-associated factor 1